MTAIYRKCLTARFLDSNSPEMLNLMSTDTDRLVNSCISFHSFWSIPFQVSSTTTSPKSPFVVYQRRLVNAFSMDRTKITWEYASIVFVQLFATLYLLYTQIGLAFISGVLFAIVLIPINRWLANRISSYSSQLLEAKDSRVSQMCEAISGAKQIKILAWEDVFIERIQGMKLIFCWSLKFHYLLFSNNPYFYRVSSLSVRQPCDNAKSKHYPSKNTWMHFVCISGQQRQSS